MQTECEWNEYVYRDNFLMGLARVDQLLLLLSSSAELVIQSWEKIIACRELCRLFNWNDVNVFVCDTFIKFTFVCTKSCNCIDLCIRLRLMIQRSNVNVSTDKSFWFIDFWLFCLNTVTQRDGHSIKSIQNNKNKINKYKRSHSPNCLDNISMELNATNDLLIKYSFLWMTKSVWNNLQLQNKSIS